MERFLVSAMEEIDRGVEIGEEVVRLLLLLLLLLFLLLFSIISIVNLITGRWV